jgi:Rrf2 family nitric oxide-sensitive transcriptional repressor
MYELAQLPAGATLSARDLCDVAEVPENFGMSLVTFLMEAGLVKAEGYRGHLLSLAGPASRITIGQIVRASESEFSLAQCSRNPQSCPRSTDCGVHEMWAQLDRIIWSHLDAITLEQVVSSEPVRLSPEPRSATDAGTGRAAATGRM